MRGTLHGCVRHIMHMYKGVCMSLGVGLLGLKVWIMRLEEGGYTLLSKVLDSL